MFDGLKRGVELIGEAISLLFRAQQAQNTECVQAVFNVFSIWFNEAFGLKLGAKKITLKNFGLALLFGADPFVGSREALKVVKAMYPNV